MDSATNKVDHSTTTFGFVVVEKDRLLKTLKDNRDKHNQVFEAACSGYWIEAQKTLQSKLGEFETGVDLKKTEFNKALDKLNFDFTGKYDRRSNAVENKNILELRDFNISFNCGSYFNFNSTWVKPYPTNHLNDFDKAILMLEYSVAEKVNLTPDEFDSYVRNNWKWKEQFVASNRGFVSLTTGLMLPTSYLYNLCVSGASAY